MNYHKQTLRPLFQKLYESNIVYNLDICNIVDDLNNIIKSIFNNVQSEYNSAHYNSSELTQKYYTILKLKDISNDFISVINKIIPPEYLLDSIRPSLECALKIVGNDKPNYHLKSKSIKDKNIKAYYSQCSKYLHGNYCADKTYLYSELYSHDFESIELHLLIYIDIFKIILGKYGLLPININYDIMHQYISSSYKFRYNIKPKR